MPASPPRIVFAGTPEFAAASLGALLEHRPGAVVGVLSQPDRPAGRGRKLQASPVKQLALEHGIEVQQPASLRDPLAQQDLAALEPELLIVAAYGLILPQAVLDLPRHGCINVHASLLPRWRGAAPIERAIEAGDRETGITIMQMDAGLDTGALLLASRCPIEAHDTGGSLRERLGALGAEALLQALDQLANGELYGIPQGQAGVSYAAKLDRKEALIAWDQDAGQLERRIRAFNPANTCHTLVSAETLRILRASPDPIDGDGVLPGTVLSADKTGIRVACGSGSLVLTELQLAGGKPMSATALLNGRAGQFLPGARLG